MRDPHLTDRFRRLVEQDGTLKRAQQMPARDRDSYLRGHFQVFERLHCDRRKPA